MNRSKLLLIFFLSAGYTLFSQEILISKDQDLKFGKFIHSPGTSTMINILEDGNRIASPGTHFLAGEYHPAVFTLSTNSLTPVRVNLNIISLLEKGKEGNNLRIVPECSKKEGILLKPNFPVTVIVGGQLFLDNNSQNDSYSGQLIVIATISED